MYLTGTDIFYQSYQPKDAAFVYGTYIFARRAYVRCVSVV